MNKKLAAILVVFTLSLSMVMPIYAVDDQGVSYPRVIKLPTTYISINK